MPFTDAGRRKAGRTRKGKRRSSATRAAISRGLKGKTMTRRPHALSAGAREKISHAMMEYWHRNKRRVNKNRARMSGRGQTNAQVLGIKSRTTRHANNSAILSRKQHRNIHGTRQRTNRRVVSSVHR